MRLVHFFMILCLTFCLTGEIQAKNQKNKHKTKTHVTKVVKKAKPKAAAQSQYARKRYLNYIRPVPSSIQGSSQLAAELTRIVESGNGSADVGVYVKSMKYGDTLYSRNIYQAFVPASTMKIFTAEAALLYLGPEYRFSTQLLTDAKSLKNGVLQGNLYVVLSGDPTLTYDDLVDLIDSSLRNHQIQGIAGNVYIDNTAYDQRFYGPGWVGKDRNYCYGAPISASIINHNCLPFKLKDTSQAPTQKYFYSSGRTKSAKRTRSRSCVLSRDSSSLSAIDSCMNNSSINYVVTDVPEYNRALFKSLFYRSGIDIYGSVTFGTAPYNLSLVGQHASKPLNALIHDMLKKSDNVIAGALFKKLGQLYSHQPGSWENGSLAVSQILTKQAGVNISGMRILDGSGLSPYNLATPAQMMQVLEFAYHHNPTSTEFISALPISGVDGTLKHRMGNIIRKVRAKTGTISGVVSLAGYVVNADKEPLAFVIMINGNKGMGWRYKSLEDRIATALTKYRRTYS